MKSLNKQNAKDVKATKPGGDYSDASLLILTMADTTWRIFVPMLAMTLLGIKMDLSFGSKPWVTLIGLALGATIAGLLVIKQLKRIEGKK